MRESFTYGSVGGALGNQCFYPESGENNIGSSSGKAPLGNYGGKAYARLGKFIACTMGLQIPCSHRHLS